MAGGSKDRSPERLPLIDPVEFSDFLKSAQVMLRVIYAVVLRESRTRHGRSDLGYAWAIFDPLIELGVLMLVFIALGRTSPLPVPLPVFLLTGLLPFHFFRDCVSRGASAASANQALLTYPQVKVMDIVVGRVVLEMITACLVYVCFMVGLHYITGESFSSWYDHPTEMMCALLGIFLFGLGFAVFSCSLARLSPVWTTIWPFLSRPLWFTSGMFFVLEHLPNNARAYAIYNPIAHMIEWWRSASLPSFTSTVGSPTYVIATGAVTLFIGLGLDRLLNLVGHSDEPAS
ncbi:ABC transporter permease [Sphingomonas sp. ID0503]|uniref:ABC transporter permease n=1 Tax=Sphingomonas sp. ID0503 TaxID=3399691 RepID=UPI003AFA3B61